MKKRIKKLNNKKSPKTPLTNTFQINKVEDKITRANIGNVKL